MSGVEGHILRFIARASLVFGVGLAVSVAVGAARAHADATGLRKITVDATIAAGVLRPFSGIHGAPAAEFAGRSPHDLAQPESVDISAAYRAARIDLIRTHDEFGPGDIDAQFGGSEDMPRLASTDRNSLTIFPDMSADAKNPNSYHFASTDRLIASIKSVGAEPLFRIGRSIGAAPAPPADFDKYAEIARHIVLHYNQGWDKGFRYAIRYWEIWNEPDFKFFWTGSAQQYYALYAKTAGAIKAADPAVLVGGPTMAKPLDAGAFREGFMDYVRQNRLPLDFLSWHFYTLDSNDPFSFVFIARTLRTLLDSNGFSTAQSVLDEWNVDLFDRDLSTAGRAAFAASALIYMLGAPIDRQTYYRGDTAFRHRNAEPDAVGHALIAFGTLKDTPLLVQTAGGDDAGFAVIAGRSANQRTIQVLISNYAIAAKYLGPRVNGDVAHIPNVMDVQLPARRQLVYHDNRGYDAEIKVPTSGQYRVKRYRISDSTNFALVDQVVHTGPSIHLQAALPPPGIEFIVITAL